MTPDNILDERGRLELLYYISRELNRRLNLRTQIERTLEFTSTSVGAETGSLILVNDDGEVINGAMMLNGSLVANAAVRLKPQIETGLAGWALRERKPALVRDTANDVRWQASQEYTNVRPVSKSAIAAPLLYSERVLGVITLVHSEPNHFTENDQALVNAIAELAAIAVENARLLDESRKQTQAMSNLVEAAQVLSSTMETDRLLHLLLAQTLKILNLEAASIALISPETKELVFQLSEGAHSERLIGLRLKIGQGIAGWVAQTGQPIFVPDVKKSPHFFGGVDNQTGFVTRSIACAPITFEGHLMGVIEGLNPAPDAVDRNTLPMLTGIASLAGNAIAHAQQFSFTQSAKDRYAGLFEDSLDPIITTDLEGGITDANHKARVTFGYTRSDMIGVPIKEMHRSTTGANTEGKDLFSSDRIRDLVRGIEQSFETQVITKEGREIPVEVHAKRISTPEHDFIQWIERDISERMKIEEMREDLMSMIFHDLRAPLGNIMSSVTLLQSSMPTDDEINNSVLGIAARSGQHLARLVDSLLDLRRFESGKAVLSQKEASILPLIADAVEQVHPIAQGKSITLTFNLPPKLPTVFIDGDMIRRVLINLIENSVKYTPNEGAVSVLAQEENDQVIVSIQDNGPGIPEAERARVFEKFMRIRREGGPKGLGLGLAFVKMAIEAHGGKVWVDPATDHGAIFRFSLPVKN
ncbi:MAG: GAF domain-containing protein [Chloroflexota bacterium]